VVNAGLTNLRVSVFRTERIVMGKLTNMVAEESSFGNRLKYNARRARFAGIGLFGKLEQERDRLYQQVVEKGNGSADDGLVALLNTLGSGVVSLALEESRRVFDDLVETGEALTKASKHALAQKKPAKKEAPVVLKAVESVAKKETAKKPAANVVTAVSEEPAVKAGSRKKAEELVAEETLLAFGNAKARVKTLSTAPDQATLLALYALFKQGEDGDVKGRRPALAKMVERAKFDARRELKGMTKTEAIGKYIAKVEALAE